VAAHTPAQQARLRGGRVQPLGEDAARAGQPALPAWDDGMCLAEYAPLAAAALAAHCGAAAAAALAAHCGAAAAAAQQRQAFLDALRATGALALLEADGIAFRRGPPGDHAGSADKSMSVSDPACLSPQCVNM